MRHTRTPRSWKLRISPYPRTPCLTRRSLPGLAGESQGSACQVFPWHPVLWPTQPAREDRFRPLGFLLGSQSDVLSPPFSNAVYASCWAVPMLRSSFRAPHEAVVDDLLKRRSSFSYELGSSPQRAVWQSRSSLSEVPPRTATSSCWPRSTARCWLRRPLCPFQGLSRGRRRYTSRCGSES